VAQEIVYYHQASTPVAPAIDPDASTNLAGDTFLSTSINSEYH